VTVWIGIRLSDADVKPGMAITAFSSCEKPRLLKKTSGAKHCLKQRLARAKNRGY